MYPLAAKIIRIQHLSLPRQGNVLQPLFRSQENTINVCYMRVNDTDSIDIELVGVSVLPGKNTLNDFVKLNKCGISRHNHPAPSLVSLEVKRYRKINCPFFHDCVLLNIIILSFPSDVYFGIAVLRYRKQHIKGLFFSVPQSQNFGQRV